MNTMFKKDYYRMTGKKWGISSYLELLMHYDLRYLYYIRCKRGGGTHIDFLKIW